jgi:multidrug efflux system membrane fusion protein
MLVHAPESAGFVPPSSSGTCATSVPVAHRRRAVAQSNARKRRIVEYHTIAPMRFAGWVLSLVFLTACHGEDAYQKPLTAVKVQPLEQQAAQAASRYSASVEPFARVDLAFKVGGYVRDITQVKGLDGAMRAMQEGDAVTKGTILANVREGDYLQRVAGAKALLAEATAAREQLKIESDRTQKLVASGSMASANLDQTKAQLDAANARVDAANAQLGEAQNAVADTALRTPIDGVVLKRGIEVGSLVAPGALGFVIADTRSVKAVFGVPDVMVEKLQLGSELGITTEAVPGIEFKGRITRVSPSADPKSRVFEVETTIPNPTQQLKAGMVAALKVPEGAASAPATVVPLASVIRSPKDPNGFAVFIISDEGGKSVAHTKDVQLGDPLGNRILVTGGLGSGDKVVVRGATLISEGEIVQVIP